MKKDRQKKQKQKKTHIKKPLKAEEKVALEALIVICIELAITLPIHFLVRSFTWYWFAFCLIAVLIPVNFAYAKVLFESKIQLSEAQKNNLSKNIGRYVLLFWLYDCVYMAIFNQWLLWIFILAGLSLIIIFYNLVMFFYSE